MSDPTPSQPLTSAGEREGQALQARGKPGQVSPTPSISDLAEAIRRGWAVSPERKRQYMAALDDLVRTAPEVDDAGTRANIVIGANRVYQMEQQAALKDLHQIEHDARLDAGLATERIGIAPAVTLRGLPDEEHDGDSDTPDSGTP